MGEHRFDEAGVLRERAASLLAAALRIMSAADAVWDGLAAQGVRVDRPYSLEAEVVAGLDELGDPDLPVDRLAEHVAGLAEFLYRLKMIVGTWMGRVVSSVDGLNRRPADWASTSVAMDLAMDLAMATLASLARTVCGPAADPGVVRALTLVAPHAPPARPASTGIERAA
jgi:hypothetical protein